MGRRRSLTLYTAARPGRVVAPRFNDERRGHSERLSPSESASADSRRRRRWRAPRASSSLFARLKNLCSISHNMHMSSIVTH